MHFQEEHTKAWERADREALREHTRDMTQTVVGNIAAALTY